MGADNQYLISKSGCVVCEFAKFDGTTWKNQPKDLKEDIIKNVMQNSNYDGSPLMELAIEKQLANCHKNRQYKLLHVHFKKCGSKEEALLNRPDNVREDEWVKLCDKFTSEDFKKKSKKNKQNRAINQVTPTVGSVSIARHVHTEQTAKKKVFKASELYRIGHYSNKHKKMVNDSTKKILSDLIAEEGTSSNSTLVQICMNKLGGIPGHLKGRCAPTKHIISAENFRMEAELERQRANEATTPNEEMGAQLAVQRDEMH